MCYRITNPKYSKTSGLQIRWNWGFDTPSTGKNRTSKKIKYITNHILY